MSLMGLNKTKKEQKLKREFRQLLRELDKNINALTRETNEAVKSAAEAKEKGTKQHYQKAINIVRYNLDARAKYVSLRMDIKMALNLRGSLQIMRAFSESMSKWSKSISKISKEINIDKVIENVDNATMILDEKNQELEDLEQTISTGFDDLVNQGNSEVITNDDAIRLVDSYIAKGPESKNEFTDKDLDSIRKAIDGDK